MACSGVVVAGGLERAATSVHTQVPWQMQRDYHFTHPALALGARHRRVKDLVKAACTMPKDGQRWVEWASEGAGQAHKAGRVSRGQRKVEAALQKRHVRKGKVPPPPQSIAPTTHAVTVEDA